MLEEERIHILQICGNPVGGTRKHVHSILMGLDNQQFKQSYAYSIETTDSKFKNDIFRLNAFLLESTVPLKIKKKPDFLDIVNLYKLIKYIKSNNVDIVHGHGAKGGAYARLLGFICGIKSIYTPHGGSVHKMFSPLADMIYALIEKLLFSITDYFVFESNYTANTYHNKVKRSSNRWIVNYNGIEPININDVQAKSITLGYKKTNSNSFHIGIFGMLCPQKGQIYAINAISRIVESGINIIVHLYGNGPDLYELKKEVEFLGIINQVIFHDEVSEVEPHMYAMDLILIPSVFESFGYVAVEAIALGKYVIASDVGGLREIIQSNCQGVLIPHSNPDAIASAVINYFKERNNKNEIIKINTTKQFSLDIMLEKLSNIYLNIKLMERN